MSLSEPVAVHVAISCDGCGMSPIIGIRFRCTSRDNYDLCAACEAAEPQPFPMERISDPDPKYCNYSDPESVFKDPRYVRQQTLVGSLLRQLIASSCVDVDKTSYYSEADLLWAQSETAWADRRTAQHEAAAAEEARLQATTRLDRARAVLQCTESINTTLGHFANLTGTAASLLAALPGLVPQGISVGLGATAAAARTINYLWTHRDVVAAELALSIAEGNAKRARDIASCCILHRLCYTLLPTSCFMCIIMIDNNMFCSKS